MQDVPVDCQLMPIQIEVRFNRQIPVGRQILRQRHILIDHLSAHQKGLILQAFRLLTGRDGNFRNLLTAKRFAFSSSPGQRGKDRAEQFVPAGA